MIKKKSLWYFMMFSIIVFLCIYYVTIPNDLLDTVNIKDKDDKNEVVETIEEVSSLVALRVNLQEERQIEMTALQKQLTDNSTTDEKNNAYEKLKYLNEVEATEEELELKLKENLNLDCFVKLDDTNISTVCISNEHDEKLANSVMRTLQSSFDEKKYITVKFQKS